MKKVFVIAIALTLALTALAYAGANPDAKVAIHVRAYSAKGTCTIVIGGCNDIVTSIAAMSIQAYPVYYELTEYKGVAYGMCWPADWSSGTFTNCSDLYIPDWTGSYMPAGSGAAHTWTNCMTGVAIPGAAWIYAYSPGMICPCPHPDPGIEGGIQVLDCAEGLDFPNCLRCAGVYLTGDDPCEPTATENATWSEIKGLFE